MEPRGRFLSLSFSNGTGSRTYKLYLPSDCHSQPYPLIVMLHACKPRRKSTGGKTTWPGRKEVFRRYAEDGSIAEDVVGLEAGAVPGEALLRPAMRAGRRVARSSGSAGRSIVRRGAAGTASAGLTALGAPARSPSESAKVSEGSPTA